MVGGWEGWQIVWFVRDFNITVGRTPATVYEAGAAARYFMSSHAGVELGYGLTWIKATLDHRPNGKGFAGQLKYSLQNARLAVVVTP